MMKVVGEEGVSLKDYVDYLKGEFFDFVYLQQNAFDPVDEATPRDRQEYIFSFIYNRILKNEFDFKDKEETLHFFQSLGQKFKGWNSTAKETEDFISIEKDIVELLETKIKVNLTNV